MINANKMLYNDQFQDCEFETLKGHTLKNYISYDDSYSGGSVELEIKSRNGYTFKFRHYQQCCEHVYLEDVLDDLLDIIQSDEEILYAEKSSSEDDNYNDQALEFPGDSENTVTYTFYKLRTKSYSCTLRFYGTSNGCYSEDVDFEVCKTED